MRLLVLGGSGWLGFQIAARAVGAGHETTCMTRTAGIPAGTRHVRADRDQPDALDGVRREQWDAVIDVADEPGHVRRAVAALEPVAARYLFISSGSVYASQAEIGATENAERLAPLEADTMTAPEDFGHGKVASEDAVLASYGASRATIVRAGLIGGPGDPSGRTDYWPWRFARPAAPDGAVLVPDAPQLPASVIDVRDLADWVLHCVTHTVTGVFNAFGEPVSFPAFITAARSAAAHHGPVRLAPEDWLLAHDVHQWAGPRSLPLWLIDRSWHGMNTRSNTAAITAGLTLRPLEQTLADALTARLASTPTPMKAGLSNEDERELLAMLDPARGSDAPET